MTPKRMNEVREMAYEVVERAEVQGFTYLGRSSEGLIFENPETFECFVIKVIAKKEGFEPTEAIEEYEEKQERAREKAEKAKAKAEKAKKEKE